MHKFIHKFIYVFCVSTAQTTQQIATFSSKDAFWAKEVPFVVRMIIDTFIRHKSIGQSDKKNEKRSDSIQQ